MRRILIFSLVYYPRYIGGAEVAVKEITDRIPVGEIEFDMITLRKHAPAFERVGNINVHRVGLPWMGKNTKSSRIFPLSKILFIPLAFIKAVSLHKYRRYDAVWVIMASYAGFAATLFKNKNPNIPFLLTIQEGDNFERREGVFRGLFTKIFKAADKIQVISNFLADWSRKMGATCPITVIPNAVDFTLFSTPIALHTAEKLKLKVNKKAGDIFLITTSRLVAKNAVRDIISALQFLPKNVKLLILGTGPEEAMLKKLSAKFNVTKPNLDLEDPTPIMPGDIRMVDIDAVYDAERIQFLGFVDHAHMPAYLQISDIFIRPSLTEGFGNSFIEAMAAGIPVIATPVGGIVDFIRDGETGLFAEVRNPQSIAQKVEKLLKDRESRDYIVAQAKKMVKERYDWAKIAGDMKSFFC